MRTEPSILHADLDAFFASVEQLDKPSLRGKPVIVCGVGPRGVVAAASYEARVFGVHSAMSTAEARARCPKAAFLSPRFEAYRAASTQVMAILAKLSPLVEPLSLDEAYVDLAAGGHCDLSAAGVRSIAAALKQAVRARVGLDVSVGAGTSKLMAKIASDLDKPDGLVVVAPGDETAVLRALPVRSLPGVGPATAARLRAVGVRTVADLTALPEPELVGLLGTAHGTSLWRLARGLDDRPVVPSREAKSVSVEDTFEYDIADPGQLHRLLTELADRTVRRLRRHHLSGRTVTVKVRLHDLSTVSRSFTLAAPTDDPRVVARLAHQLLEEVDTAGGVRLLGVGVSGLADWTQDQLFVTGPDQESDAEGEAVPDAVFPGGSAPHGERSHRWSPGQDVEHPDFGAGWVQGSGARRVTVRFETRQTPPHSHRPIRTFADDDPLLVAVPPPSYGERMERSHEAAGHTIELSTPDGPMGLYDAAPEGAVKGGLIVIQEAYGVTAHIEDVARRAATAGYRAVAPHLFHRTGSPVLDYDDLATAKEHMAKLTQEGLLADLAACLEHLSAAGYPAPSVGVVGFCMGGSVVTMAATHHALGAAVSFYGGGLATGRFGMPPLLELALALQTPWLGLFGDQDASIPPADVERMRELAASAPVPTEVVRYPDAGHGFHCDARPKAYHEASARDAWTRAIAWLDRFVAAS